MTRGELHEFLSRDHERLDALLTAAVRPDGTIDHESYVAFRGGLLWHIAVEERLLMPAVRKHRSDSEVEKQLHRDHAALAGLLVPPPSAAGIATMRAILEAHNPLEEGSGGFYEVVEELTGEEISALMERVRALPPIPLAPHFDTEVTRRSIEELLRAAEEGRRKLAR